MVKIMFKMTESVILLCQFFCKSTSYLVCHFDRMYYELHIIMTSLYLGTF